LRPLGRSQANPFGKHWQRNPFGGSMAKKQSAPTSPQVSRQTLITSVVIALMIGFFGGLVFSIYKTSQDLSAPVASDAARDQQLTMMLAALEEKVRANPQDVAAWVQIGNIHFDGERFRDAIAAYEKALALEPRNAEVLTDLGIMYRRAGDPQEAVRRFDQAIAVDPKLENPRFNKGIVLLNDLKDREGAIQAWEALLALNPLARAPNGQSLDELITHYKEHQ
jgi:cytochrome c-type biogenesis protein CcmH/NrfG